MPKLFENLWVKIAALILATLLWFHVATEKVYLNQITLELTQVDLPPDLVLMEPAPESVMVTVSATGKSLLRSDWKKSGTRLVITSGRPGRFSYDINTENLLLVKSELVSLIEVIAPREFMFRCDRQMDKTVPVVSKMQLIPDQGFAVSGGDSLSPTVVTVTGPRTTLDQVEQIETQPLRLDGVRNDLIMRTALIYPDIYGLKITPDSVDLFISVVPAKTRVFSDVPIRLQHPPLNREVSIAPATVELRFSGAPNAIDNMDRNRIGATASFVHADSNGVAPITINFPKDVKLQHKSVSSVRIIDSE